MKNSLRLFLIFTVLGANLFQLVDGDITYTMTRRPGIDLRTEGSDGSCWVVTPDVDNLVHDCH